MGTGIDSFMSFCRTLSTLCSHIVFHNLPHFSRGRGKRAGQNVHRKIAVAVQKVHRKIAVAVQNVKPLYFLFRSFEIREKYCQQSFFLSIVIQLTITKETRRRVSRGRD